MKKQKRKISTGQGETVEEHEEVIRRHMDGPYPWHRLQGGVALDFTDEDGRWKDLWWLAWVKMDLDGVMVVLARMTPTVPTLSAWGMCISAQSTEQAMGFVESEYDMVMGRPERPEDWHHTSPDSTVPTTRR